MKKFLRPTMYPVMGISLLAGTFMIGCTTTSMPIKSGLSVQTSGHDRQSRRNTATYTTTEASAKENKWGIRVVGLRTTMAGMMIDFRYKITDPSKAASLLDIKNKAYLRVEKNGAQLGVPNSVKIGSLRQTTHAKKVKKGKDYFILFGNPGRKYAEPGDKLAVVIGDVEFDNLILQ